MTNLDAIAELLASQRPVTVDTPPGAVVHEGDVGTGPVFWSSCHRCCWWGSDDGGPDDYGFRSKADAQAEADHHNATVTIHRMKGHRTP